MPNLGGLSAITTAAGALSGLILVSPQKVVGYQPQSKKGPTAQQPPALLFHYEGEQTVALESDITDHFVENNSAIEDQISLKPEIVTVHGFIGELNNVPPRALALLQAAANKLGAVGAYAPGLSATALIAYNQAFMLYQVGSNAINAGVAAWSSLSGKDGLNVIGSGGIGDAFNAETGQVKGNQSKQQVAFQQFYGYWRTRQLFTVQTPWAIFQNMAIKSLRAIQDADTRMITDFEVQFKMMRFAATSNTNGVGAILQGRAAAQASGLVDLGTTSPIASIGVGAGLAGMGQ